VAVATGWTNPCGGTQWRTLSDGRIEVEGAGVLTFAPGSAFEKYLKQSWANFEPEIRAASAKRGVTPNAIVAVMTTETGLWSSSRARQMSQCSSCCCGPMAVWSTPGRGFWPANYGYTPDQIVHDPMANIDAGAALIRKGYDQGYQLPHIVAAYNSGSYKCCPTSPDVPNSPGGRQKNPFNLCSASPGGISYPEMVIRGNNTALALGIGGSAGGGAVWPYAMGAFMVVGGIALIWSARR